MSGATLWRDSPLSALRASFLQRGQEKKNKAQALAPYGGKCRAEATVKAAEMRLSINPDGTSFYFRIVAE